jgi:hypothetical protein
MDQVALELGKRCKDAEDKPASHGRGIDVPGQHLSTDTPLLQIADQPHDVRQRTTDPVQFPHNQSIALSRGVERL